MEENAELNRNWQKNCQECDWNLSFFDGALARKRVSHFLDMIFDTFARISC